MDPQVIAFMGVALLLTITPGADTMLVIRNVLAYGRRAGFLTMFGICSGLFVHATLSALGLSFILVNSAETFETARLIGAAYLIYLGVQSIWSLWRNRRNRVESANDVMVHTPEEAWRSFMQGLLSNVLNPKVAIFYLTFLPQFINPGESVLGKSILLAAFHLVMGAIWLSSVAFFVNRMQKLLMRSNFQQGLEAITGTILIGLGIRLALDKR